MGRGRNKQADEAQQPQASGGDDSENDATAAGVGQIHVHWDQHKLAKRWEDDRFLRKRGRQFKCLTMWASNKTIGIATLKGIYLNSHALLHLARLWCPLVVKWREEMLLPEDDVMVYRDQWGKRDALVDEFFEILERHWGKIWKPSRRRSSKSLDALANAVEDDDEEEAVDPDQLSDAEESAGIEVEVHAADTDEYGGGVDAPPGSGIWSDSEEMPPHDLSLLAPCASDPEEKPITPSLDEKISDDLDGVEMDLEEQLLMEQIMSRIEVKEPSPDNLETQINLEAGDTPTAELPSASALRAASSEEVLDTPPPRNLLPELDAKVTPEKTCCPEANPAPIDKSEKKTAAPDEALPDTVSCCPEANHAAIHESENKKTAAPDEALLDVASFEERSLAVVLTRLIYVEVSGMSMLPRMRSLAAHTMEADVAEADVAEVDVAEEAGWTWSGGDADSWSWMTPNMEWHYDAWLDGEKAVSSNECVAAPIGDELMPVTKRFKRKASQLQVEQEIAPAPKKSKKSPDPKGEQKKEKTFACRAVPTGAVGYARFSAIKKAFQDHLQLYLERPSKYQDPFYKDCQASFKKHKSQLAKGERTYMDLAVKTAKVFAKLGISLILQGKWSQLCCVFGRNLLTPEGRQDLPNVRYANQLLSRTLLLMLLCVAAGGSVFLENPASSVMFDTDSSLQDLCSGLQNDDDGVADLESVLRKWKDNSSFCRKGNVQGGRVKAEHQNRHVKQVVALPEKVPLQALKSSTSTILEPETAQPPHDDDDASTVPAPELQGWSQDRQPSALSAGDVGLPTGSDEKAQGQHECDAATNIHEEPSPKPEKPEEAPTPTQEPEASAQKAEATTQEPEALPEATAKNPEALTQTQAPIPAAKPTAKPTGPTPPTDPHAIPVLGDQSAPEPPKDQPSLSPSAIDKRMRRVMNARADGSYKVPSRFVDEWKKRGTARKSLEKILASVGYDPEAFVQELHEIHESYFEQELVIEGAYSTVETMTTQYGWTESFGLLKRIQAVVEYCKSNPAKYIRRDLYEPDILLYWCELTVKGTQKEGERNIRRSSSTFEAEGVAGAGDPTNFPSKDPAAGAPVELGAVPSGSGNNNKDAADLRKRAGVPEMDPNSCPSSHVFKIKKCIDARTKKMNDIITSIDDIKKDEITKVQMKMLDSNNLCTDVLLVPVFQSLSMNPSVLRTRDRLNETVQILEKFHDELTTYEANGVVDGFSKKDEEEILQVINEVKKKITKCCKVPDSWPKACDRSFKLTEQEFRELLSQYPTTSSHSFLSRHLVFVLPTHLVKKGPEVLNAALAACARDLKELFETGIDVDGVRYFAALLALKGDQKWHASTGNFFRSYSHLGDVNSKQICHECLGGDILYPFEDTSSGAGWIETLFESEPWLQPGPLELIPFDASMPARKYKRDLLHVFKIGLGRDIAGSTIYLLARFFGWFDHAGDSVALENQLKRAHSRLVLWASAAGYAWTNSKGSDTMILLQWLCFELSLAEVLILRIMGDLAGDRDLV
ncbi:unnamed protein product [Symbiodinium sp. KB8]|nr:unnamed protein product [Symbiodinium sp. KB8]